MKNRFYVCDTVFKSMTIHVYQIEDDDQLSFATRTNAMPQMTRQTMRVLLNSMMKMLGDSDYEMYARQVHGSGREIAGYEFIIHDPDLALQFKLTWC